MNKIEMLEIIIMILIAMIGSVTVIYVFLFSKNRKKTIENIRRENKSFNYYLQTEIPMDIQERYMNNLNQFNNSNFNLNYIERLSFEIKKLRKDIEFLTDTKNKEINEIINNKSNNVVFDYEELISQISKISNIDNLFSLLNETNEEQFKYIKNVLADIVHTIRNPASGMRAIISILKMENCDIQFIEKINDLEKYIDDIEDSLNAYYQISHTEVYNIDEKDSVRLKDEIKSRSELLGIASGKKVDIQNNICDVELCKNTSDILILAITCILENAIDFCKDNGIIKISSTFENGTLTIEIYNDGSSIDDAFLEKVFEQGFSTRKSSGRGLAIVKQAIEKTLNGIVYCENVEDKGVKFVILIEGVNDNE